MKILLVEDETDLASAVSRALSDEHFAVDWSADGEDALYRARECAYDAIVLDVLLPGPSGWDVLRTLRGENRLTPVIMLTALDTIEDRVRGLNHGADDYLVKPFAIEELVARLRALGRRAANHPSPTVQAGDVRIDLAARRVYRGDAEVELTAREYSILEKLARRRSSVVTRTEIAEALYNDDEELFSNAIDVHVAALRRKLGDQVIRTRRGLGYFIDG